MREVVRRTGWGLIVSVAATLLLPTMLSGCSDGDDGGGTVCSGNSCTCPGSGACSATCLGTDHCEIVCGVSTDCSASCGASTQSCQIQCNQAGACRADCTTSNPCTVYCPLAGCTVSHCTLPGCTVACANPLVTPTRAGDTATCPAT
jgi:hypothetical protein